MDEYELKLEEERRKRRVEYNRNNKEFVHQLKKKAKVDVVAEKATGSCPICTEDYSARLRKRLVCPYSCGLEACTVCHTKYLKDSTTDWHCMGCRRELDVRFIRVNFSEKQQQELNAQRRLVLLAKDEAKLPEAQMVLEERQRQKEINRRIRILEDQIQDLRDSRGIKVEKVSNDSVPIKCPLGECRGYIRRGICGVCEKRICMKCMQQVVRKKDHDTIDLTQDTDDDPSHVCDPEILSNLKLIRASAKACPKCGVWTTRSAGCNQMWCINCHVAWDWATNREIHGTIHNPHFFEWQLKTQGSVQRNPNDVLCGGLPRVFNKHFPDYEFLNRALQCIHEVNDERHRPTEPNNEDVQVLFLEGRINKEVWANTILKRDKLFRIKQQFYNIHQMFHLAGTDILQRRYSNQLSPDQTSLELNALRLYYNKELLKLAQENNGKHKKFYKLISPVWTITDWRDTTTIAECLG